MASCLYPTVHSCNLLPLKHLAQVLLPQMRAAGKGYALARSFLPVAKFSKKEVPFFDVGKIETFGAHTLLVTVIRLYSVQMYYTPVHLFTKKLYTCTISPGASLASVEVWRVN